jgi:hypothetical protein
MQTVYRNPLVTASSGPTAEVEADLLVLPLFEDDALEDESELDDASGGEIARARDRRELTGKLYQVFVTGLAGPGRRTSRVALVGAGARLAFSPDRLRRIATTGALAARQRRLARVAILQRASDSIDAEVAAQAMAEGACLA